MSSKPAFLVTLVSALAAAAFAALAIPLRAKQPTHNAPAHGGTVVMLCDGKTSVEIKDLKPGQTMSHSQAQAVAESQSAPTSGGSEVTGSPQ